MNLSIDFEIISREFESITGGKPLVDHHLNLMLYKEDDQGRVFIDSAVITREEMLDFLGLDN